MPKVSKGKIIFKAKNNHSKNKGNPPVIDTSNPNSYCAYFESIHREQLIFTYQYEVQIGTLWLSRKGWEHPFHVIGGKAQNVGLSPDEKTWLKACWNVATTRQKQIEHQQKLLAGVRDDQFDPYSPDSKEVYSHMEHLYDYLLGTGIAPNCSRDEFASGWSTLIGFVEYLETKYRG